MTPLECRREMERAIQVCQDRETLAAVGEGIINKYLGPNAFAFVAEIDAWCRAMRSIGKKRVYGPPTNKTVGRVLQPESAL